MGSYSTSWMGARRARAWRNGCSVSYLESLVAARHLDLVTLSANVALVQNARVGEGVDRVGGSYLGSADQLAGGLDRDDRRARQYRRRRSVLEFARIRPNFVRQSVVISLMSLL